MGPFESIQHAHRPLALAALVFAGSQCGPPSGLLGPTGFDQPTFGYHIGYAKAEAQSFLGPDWRIDNFKLDESTHEWTAKDGPSYEATRELDEDEDGDIGPREKHKEYVYDLRLANVHDNGVIWIKAHPMTVHESQRDLDVELSNYADSLSGTGAFYQGSIFSLEHVKARSFTTFLVAKEPKAVAGLEGLIGTIEVAETARVQLDSTYRSAKIRMWIGKITYDVPLPAPEPTPGPNEEAMARPPPAIKPSDVGPHHWPVVPCVAAGRSRCERSVGLLVIGYVNDATRFDGHLAEYESFLSQVTLASVKTVSALLRGRVVGAI